MRYTDPSGHCPTCAGAAIGAIVGSVAGASLYVSYAYQTSDFDVNEYYASVVGGAVVGAGVGANPQGVAMAGVKIAGNAATMVAGAFVGGAAAGGATVVGQATNYITDGTPFNIEDTAIATTNGAVYGAAAPYVATGVATTAALGSIATASQYAATQYYHGNPIEGDNLIYNLAWGELGGLGVLAPTPTLNLGSGAGQAINGYKNYVVGLVTKEAFLWGGGGAYPSNVTKSNQIVQDYVLSPLIENMFIVTNNPDECGLTLCIIK